MIVRLRPRYIWSFEEKLVLCAVGASGSIREAARNTGLSEQAVGDLLETALTCLPRCLLPVSAVAMAMLWWRGADPGVWCDQFPAGDHPSEDPMTLWWDQWERLRKEHSLARGQPSHEIVQQVCRACITLPGSAPP